MSLTEMLNTTTTWAAANLPILIGGGVAVVVLTIVFFKTRSRGGLDAEKVLAATGSGSHTALNDKATEWAPPQQSYADRRGAVRRDGAPVKVILASTTFRNGLSDGYVLDRSTGGMRLAMSAAIAPGSLVQARAVNAPDTVGFVTLIVRSCRKNADFFEVGCEFEKTPPWNVLLLFG